MDKIIETIPQPKTVIANTSTVTPPLPKQGRPTLSSYKNYREFLRDFYTYKRKTESSPVRAYSYATFSAAADIKSPNYLKLIIDGKRNLSESMVEKFARALGLNRQELAEFKILVRYGQARDPLERNRFLKDLSEYRVGRQLKEGKINASTWEKVPNWVTWVLHAMADQDGAKFDLDSLLPLLRGRVSREEVRRSLDGLFESGELTREETTGAVRKGHKLMQGSEDVPSALVRKLQAELIYLGLESLFQDEATDREFAALTLAMTADEFEQAKFELRKFKKELYKNITMNREQTKADRVYQLNVQLFPITDKARK